MLKLYQFYPLPTVPNASLFCMKVETYLKMAQIPYQTVHWMNPSKAPKGKLPFIEDNGQKIADSRFIIEYLQRQYPNTLDDHLSPQQKAYGAALARMVDEHLYWVVVYSRWQDKAHWPLLKQVFFAHMSSPLKWFVPQIVRKLMLKQLHNQGMSRHLPDEVYHIATDDLQHLANALGKQAYFLGDKPTTVDASLYALLANVLYSGLTPRLTEIAKKHTNLQHYCERMAKFFD
jgi:glutathione S-transferase